MTLHTYRQDFLRNQGAAEFVDSQSSIGDSLITRKFEIEAPDSKNVLAVGVDLSVLLTNAATATQAVVATNPSTGVASTVYDDFFDQIYVGVDKKSISRSQTLISTEAPLTEQLTYNLNKRTYPPTAAASVGASTSVTVTAQLIIPAGGPKAVFWAHVPPITNVYAANVTASNRQFSIYGYYGTDDTVVTFRGAQSDVKPAGQVSLLDQQPDDMSSDIAAIYGPNASGLTQILATTPKRVLASPQSAGMINLMATLYPDLASTFANEIPLQPSRDRFKTLQINQPSSNNQRTLWIEFAGSGAALGPPDATGTPAPPAAGQVNDGSLAPREQYPPVSGAGGGGMSARKPGGGRGGVIRKVA